MRALLVGIPFPPGRARVTAGPKLGPSCGGIVPAGGRGTPRTLLFLDSSLQKMLVVPPLLSKSLSALAALDAGKCCCAGLALKVTAILRVCKREGLFGFSVRNPPKGKSKLQLNRFPFWLFGWKRAELQLLWCCLPCNLRSFPSPIRAVRNGAGPFPLPRPGAVELGRSPLSFHPQSRA